MVVGYWAFNLWMAWSALDASGLMVVFTCFHMIFFLGGVKLPLSEQVHDLFFSESD